MTRRRLLPIELTGAALRELLPWLARLADAMDPGETAPGWTPLRRSTDAEWPDYVPDYLTREQR